MNKTLVAALGFLGLALSQTGAINCQKSEEGLAEEPVVVSAPLEEKVKPAEKDVFQEPERPKTFSPRLYLGENDRITDYSLEKWVPIWPGTDCFYRSDAKFYNSKNELIWGETAHRTVGLYGDQTAIARSFPFDEKILKELDRLVIEFTLEHGCDGTLYPPSPIEIKLTPELVKEYVRERDTWVRQYYNNNPR